MAEEDNAGLLYVAWSLIIVGWILCIPMSIFFTRFYRQRGNIMILKRYPKCVLVIFVIVMLDTIVQRPLWMLLEVGAFDDLDRVGTQEWRIFDVILIIITVFYSALYIGFSAAILWRAWLLFYDINYSKESQNGEWKQLIAQSFNFKFSDDTKKNYKHSRLKNQWFLTHVHKFGNFRWVTKHMCLLSFVVIAISYGLWAWAFRLLNGIKHGDTQFLQYYNIVKSAQIYDFCVNIILMLCLIFLARRVPVFHDYFSVATEFRLLFACGLLYYSAIVVFFVLSALSWNLDKTELRRQTTIYTLTNGFCAMCAQFLIILVQTAWVLRKIRPYLLLHSRFTKTHSKLQMSDLNNAAKDLDEETLVEQQIKENQRRQQLHLPQESVMSAISVSDTYVKMQGNVERIFNMYDVLEHSIGFDAFMMHLIRELSMECLLSFVEFTQFLNMIFMECPFIENSDGIFIPNYPANVPLSNIIAKNQEITAVQHGRVGSDQSQTRDSGTVNTPQRLISMFKGLSMQKGSSGGGAERQGSLDNCDDEYQQKVSFQILSIGTGMYYKYIRNGSELEINISGPLRRRMADVFERHEWKKNGDNTTVDVNKITTLYCKAVVELHKLLKTSWQRFAAKPDYRRLKQRMDERSFHKSNNSVKSFTDDRDVD